MSSAVERAISQSCLPVIGRQIVEILALDRRNPFAADEVVIAITDQNLFRDLV